MRIPRSARWIPGKTGNFLSLFITSRQCLQRPLFCKQTAGYQPFHHLLLAFFGQLQVYSGGIFRWCIRNACKECAFIISQVFWFFSEITFAGIFNTVISVPASSAFTVSLSRVKLPPELPNSVMPVFITNR